jgi:hypothetical protein
MSITIGLASVVVAAQFAGRLSLSSHCFLSLTRITACWRAVRHCDGALWNTAHQLRNGNAITANHHCTYARPRAGRHKLQQSAQGLPQGRIVDRERIALLGESLSFVT